MNILKSWGSKAQTWGVKVGAARAGRKLPRAVTLAKSHRIVADGKGYEGPLVADDKGVGVQAVTSVTRDSSGRREWVKVQRLYFMFWEKVDSCLIRPALGPYGDGSQVDKGDVDVSLTDADRTWTVTLHRTSVPAVTGQLSKWTSGKLRAG
jgi:hypothetical protein